MAKMLATVFKAAQVGGSFLDRIINDSHLGNPEFTGEPYPEYERLLRKGPVIRSYVGGGWCLLSYDAVIEALKDPRFSVDMRNSPNISRMQRMAYRGEKSMLGYPTLLNTDPPDHGRLRKLARTGFLRKYVQSLEPRIRELTDECLSTVQAKGQFDLVEALARPLPAYLISEILGVERDQRDRFRKLTERFFGNAGVIDFAAIRHANEAYAEILDFMEAVVEKKRVNPSEDLISALIAAEEDGEQLSAQELTTTCAILMIGGYETTMRLIGNVVYLLLRHPDQMRHLRENPEMSRKAIEETLRFEPPLQFVIRIAMEDMTFHGKRIKKHHTAILVIAAANRDPAANDRPHEFDIRREQINHVAFGHGIHLCLGAELARLEGRLALEMLLDRFPRMALHAETPRWEPGYAVRGLEELVLDVA